MQRWLNRAGYALEWMRDELRGAAALARHEDDLTVDGVRETLADLVDDVGGRLGGGGAKGLAGAAVPLVASAAGGWLANRVLRPRKVNLPRAVLAGVIGTLLFDVATLVDRRISGRNFNTTRPLGAALTDSEELQGVAGWTAHYAAGVGLAVVYARFVHGRVPAPAVVGGALFGAADALTLRWGGVLPLLNRMVPGVELPVGYAGLGDDAELSPRGVARHVAWGVAVAAVYRE